ncbi:MAG: hypothetical protein MRT15_10595 [archaeon YNP-LCB-003-016]|uniref:hypothetical protein n=1 Tax=Candidatus Culexarchaeum yellowstonense TaxID=2928963 RepID=UPI0026F0BB67|nr:hypothetical protein [Candidatus Culexarchaeum yellowstonense]MCR6692830.1 hypothetical protein [Candidatus Culexarchaeum yellowstonense]
MQNHTNMGFPAPMKRSASPGPEAGKGRKCVVSRGVYVKEGKRIVSNVKLPEDAKLLLEIPKGMIGEDVVYIEQLYLVDEDAVIEIPFGRDFIRLKARELRIPTLDLECTYGIKLEE